MVNLHLYAVGDDGTFVDDITERVTNALVGSQSIVIEEIRNAYRRNFQKGGRPVRWQPLHRRTQLERLALGYSPSKPILVRSGVLRDSWVLADAVVDIDSDGSTVSISLWSSDVRAMLHEFGGVSGLGITYIPARPVSVLTRYDHSLLRKKLKQELDHAL